MTRYSWDSADGSPKRSRFPAGDWNRGGRSFGPDSPGVSWNAGAAGSACRFALSLRSSLEADAGLLGGDALDHMDPLAKAWPSSCRDAVTRKQTWQPEAVVLNQQLAAMDHAGDAMRDLTIAADRRFQRIESRFAGAVQHLTGSAPSLRPRATATSPAAGTSSQAPGRAEPVSPSPAATELEKTQVTSHGHSSSGQLQMPWRETEERIEDTERQLRDLVCCVGEALPRLAELEGIRSLPERRQDAVEYRIDEAERRLQALVFGVDAALSRLADLESSSSVLAASSAGGGVKGVMEMQLEGLSAHLAALRDGKDVNATTPRAEVQAETCERPPATGEFEQTVKEVENRCRKALKDMEDRLVRIETRECLQLLPNLIAEWTEWEPRFRELFQRRPWAQAEAACEKLDTQLQKYLQREAEAASTELQSQLQELLHRQPWASAEAACAELRTQLQELQQRQSLALAEATPPGSPLGKVSRPDPTTPCHVQCEGDLKPHTSTGHGKEPCQKDNVAVIASSSASASGAERKDNLDYHLATHERSPEFKRHTEPVAGPVTSPGQRQSLALAEATVRAAHKEGTETVRAVQREHTESNSSHIRKIAARVQFEGDLKSHSSTGHGKEPCQKNNFTVLASPSASVSGAERKDNLDNHLATHERSPEARRHPEPVTGPGQASSVPSHELAAHERSPRGTRQVPSADKGQPSSVLSQDIVNIIPVSVPDLPSARSASSYSEFSSEASDVAYHEVHLEKPSMPNLKECGVLASSIDTTAGGESSTMLSGDARMEVPPEDPNLDGPPSEIEEVPSEVPTLSTIEEEAHLQEA